MNWYDYMSITIGVFGVAWGIRFYWELRKWAHLIKYGWVIVAYKNKVKINAPLQEWALWCRTAEKDKGSNGRAVYKLGGTTVAVVRKTHVPDTPVIRLVKAVWLTIRRPASKVNPQVQEGTWKAEDHTKKAA